MSRVDGPFRVGVYSEESNLTNLNESRVMGLVCPICFNRFTRPPSHVARVNISYCGRACSSIGATINIAVNCSECGKEMLLKPNELPKIKTCSRRCSTLRRRKPGSRGNNTSEYKDAARMIASKSKQCGQCGVKVGPFVVRGLLSGSSDQGDPILDMSGAVIWCQQCHLSDIAESGGKYSPTKKPMMWGSPANLLDRSQNS
jgi:hypothetical protein